MLPGTAEVPELARSCGVASDPRPRAPESAAKLERAGRAELAGGRSFGSPACLPARLPLAYGGGPR